MLQNAYRSVCPIRYPHKSAETIYQVHQYAFRIWLIPAVSWQALSTFSVGTVISLLPAPDRGSQNVSC